MSKGLIFFCCACAILLFTIINLSVGPIISGKVGKDTAGGNYFYWGTANCAFYSDRYDIAEKDSSIDKDTLKYKYERDKNECYRKKGMHDMEYTSFIFNAVIGFVCGLLGLLHLFDVKKEYVSKTGMIGLICGFIGFVFSFVYVILNGLVYTTYYDYNNHIYKRNSDGAFAERKGDEFECFYYEDSPVNEHSLIAKYSDLIQKQYNYDKDLSESIKKDAKVIPCKANPNICNNEKITVPGISSNCKYLYVQDSDLSDTITNKDISDRFLTTLLLSLFICLANIGLAIFGFLLFRTPGDF